MAGITTGDDKVKDVCTYREVPTDADTACYVAACNSWRILDMTASGIADSGTDCIYCRRPIEVVKFKGKSK